MTTLVKQYLTLFQNKDLKKTLLNKSCERMTEEEILNYCNMIERILSNLTLIELDMLNIVQNYDCFGQYSIYNALLKYLDVTNPKIT